MSQRILFVEHDASVIARLTGNPAPHCDRLLLRHGRPGEVLAATLEGNPLGASWLWDLDVPAARVIAWSGTLASGDGPEGLFEPNPRNWMQAGREALDRFCRDIGPQLQRHDRRLCFRPHSRHVLSDAPSCLSFLAAHGDGPFEVALAPAEMLTPTMLDSIEDHLTRLFEALGHRAALVILRDVRLGDAGAGEPMISPVPLGSGLLPRGTVVGLLEKHVPTNVPVVVSAENLAAQLDWLDLS